MLIYGESVIGGGGYVPAIRLLDTEHQTELAYLHEQLITGEPVQDG